MQKKRVTKVRRAWLTFALVLSPLGIAFLWCAFIDQEDFVAFVLGIVLTVLFSTVALLMLLVRNLIGRKFESDR
jgi:hypothetical protein